MKTLIAISALLAAISINVQAQTGLLINSAEVGVGKFHRMDSQIHPKEYAAGNVWISSIMPGKVNDPVAATPLVYSTGTSEVSIQFDSLEQLLNTVVGISKKTGQKIAVLNITGHGMPGGMWFPMDEKTRVSPECAKWVTAAAAPDKVNYDQYYEAIPKEDIEDVRQMSNMPAQHYSCVTGASEWKQVVSRIPNLKSYFTENAVINFESCTVGLGSVGDAFAKTVASLVLGGAHSMVKSLTNFGLGDWSFGEGMGFWDYQDDVQLARDNANYVAHKSDREIAQPGTIRVTYLQNGQLVSKLVADQKFLQIGYPTSVERIFSNKPRIVPEKAPAYSGPLNRIVAPFSILIPGSGGVRVQRMN
jgi:hypothetical protein